MTQLLRKSPGRQGNGFSKATRHTTGIEVLTHAKCDDCYLGVLTGLEVSSEDVGCKTIKHTTHWQSSQFAKNGSSSRDGQLPNRALNDLGHNPDDSDLLRRKPVSWLNWL
jgi:hypothetical protein